MRSRSIQVVVDLRHFVVTAILYTGHSTPIGACVNRATFLSERGELPLSVTDTFTKQ
jgi:hypothetical protein